MIEIEFIQLLVKISDYERDVYNYVLHLFIWNINVFISSLGTLHETFSFKIVWFWISLRHKHCTVLLS